VNWPAGVGGKGNEGVASYVQRISGAIGYVEYAYALQNKLTYTLVQNRDGNFVAPNIETFKAPLRGRSGTRRRACTADLDRPVWKKQLAHQRCDFHPGYTRPRTNRTGRRKCSNSSSGRRGRRQAGDGSRLCAAYPDSVVKMIQASWKNQIKDASGKSVW